ncbi:C40 family peptidase [Arcobacter vandammei]|uniref:C40 family peptidase n=1 Tax=Arcobacter vandammei TaxID=2782243 RepID=UPI0018DF4E97|nr:NlpC/P60 family protein [Arcobacter vandammei]
MIKRISFITTLLLLLLGLQTSLYANNTKTNSTNKTTNSKTQKQITQKQTTQKQSSQKNKTQKETKKEVKAKVKNNTKQVKTTKIPTNKKIVSTSNNKKQVVKQTNKTTVSSLSKNTNSNISDHNLTSYAYSNVGQKKKVFTDFYNETKHIKYKMGGTGNNGTIDCSAFTQKMFKEKFNYALSRSTVTQVNEGIEIKKSELQPGDLVFFKTSKVDKHVGVYTGNGEFLHASVKGIQYTKLDKKFYKDTYWTARRVIN